MSTFGSERTSGRPKLRFTLPLKADVVFSPAKVRLSPHTDVATGDPPFEWVEPALKRYEDYFLFGSMGLMSAQWTPGTQMSPGWRLFAFDLFHQPFQGRHRARFTSVAVFVVFKHPQKLFHYALDGERVVGSVSVGKSREVCRGMTHSRRDNYRMNFSAQLVVREVNEFIRYFCLHTLIGRILAASSLVGHRLPFLFLTRSQDDIGVVCDQATMPRMFQFIASSSNAHRPGPITHPVSTPVRPLPPRPSDCVIRPFAERHNR